MAREPNLAREAISSGPQSTLSIMKKQFIYKKIIDLVECNISPNNEFMQGGHVNVSCLSITALHSGLILADILSQSEVF